MRTIKVDVRIPSDLVNGATMVFSTEVIVEDDAEAAMQAGEQAAYILKSFSTGFGQADLGTDESTD